MDDIGRTVLGDLNHEHIQNCLFIYSNGIVVVVGIGVDVSMHLQSAIDPPLTQVLLSIICPF